MLKKFSVENFKGFRDKVTFDLGKSCNYNFNQEVISEGCITKGILFGINGSGKSNFGVAICDIICHLTDNQPLLHQEIPIHDTEFPDIQNQRSRIRLLPYTDISTLLK